MLVNGGELDGVRILSRKTVELMRTNHLPGGGDLRQYAPARRLRRGRLRRHGLRADRGRERGPALTQSAGSAGEYMGRRGLHRASGSTRSRTLVAVFMTQLVPSGTFNFRGH